MLQRDNKDKHIRKYILPMRKATTTGNDHNKYMNSV